MTVVNAVLEVAITNKTLRLQARATSKRRAVSRPSQHLPGVRRTVALVQVQWRHWVGRACRKVNIASQHAPSKADHRSLSVWRFP